MNGNLPDNVSAHDPRAPWNASDSVWDVGVLEEAAFECNACGFSMTGLQLATLEWDDDPTKQTAGDTIHACPACVTTAVDNGTFESDANPIGWLVMPHICGVTDLHCTCASDEAADQQLDHEREVSNVG